MPLCFIDTCDMMRGSQFLNVPLDYERPGKKFFFFFFFKLHISLHAYSTWQNVLKFYWHISVKPNSHGRRAPYSMKCHLSFPTRVELCRQPVCEQEPIDFIDSLPHSLV